jgi:hemin uptake protein HemP
MGGPTRIQAGELTVEEIIERLHEGNRLVIQQELLGGVHEITLRFDGDTYYCDTPTTLHRHETPEGMRICLDKQRYGAE